MGAVSEPHGTLTVTAPQMFGRMHVTPVIASLLRQHPALSVRLLLIDRFVQLVEEGIDVAVRIGVLADSALVAVRVGSVGRVVVARPDYLDANGTPAVPADLRRHSIVAFTGVTGSDEWRFGSDEKVAVQVKPRLVVNGADAAIAAAEAGLGLTRVLSYQVRGQIAADRLRTVLDHAAPPVAPVSLLFQASRAGSPNVRSFVDEAAAHLRDADL